MDSTCPRLFAWLIVMLCLSFMLGFRQDLLRFMLRLWWIGARAYARAKYYLSTSVTCNIVVPVYVFLCNIFVTRFVTVVYFLQNHLYIFNKYKKSLLTRGKIYDILVIVKRNYTKYKQDIVQCFSN